MPAPKIGQCGGEGQPACPPTPALEIQLPATVVIEGQTYAVTDEDDQGEDQPQ